MDKIPSQNLKNYQVWCHRRLLQLQVRDPFQELIFITKHLNPNLFLSPSPKKTIPNKKIHATTPNPTLNPDLPKKPNGSGDEPPVCRNGHGVPADTKNYHTWAYRQWLLVEFNQPELWAGELEFVGEMLHDDVRNNSAWHHRFFVVWDSGIREGEVDSEAVLRRKIE
ncbi:CAAX geranylgeranyltransferase alpha subunit [Tulasnella sp. 418]|nr:CAAX geranylgeranyltransferase alpha subunit [Tulasnella sp. 418]